MEKILGIVGGIGPYAGLDLVEKIFDNTIAKSDEEHIPVILYSVPTMIPDRNKYILKETETNPAKGLINALEYLSNAGASVFCIACNTAHSEIIFNDIKQWISKNKFQFISLIDSAAEYLINNYKKEDINLAVLSTKGTYYSKVYENTLEKHGFFVEDIGENLANEIHEIIINKNWGIKSISNPVSYEARKRFNKIVNELKNREVNTLILGCTELPLLFDKYNKIDIEIIDPTEILARNIVNIISPKKLKL